MIEELTKEKLKECGFKEDDIERLMNWDSYELKLVTDNGYFFASNIEQKIYSGKDGFFKNNDSHSFPFHDISLMGEHFNRKRAAYFDKQKELMKEFFIEDAEKEQFKQDEIKHTKESLEFGKNKDYKKDNNQKLEGYLKWLDSYKDEKKSSKVKTINSYTWIGKPQNKNQLYKDLKGGYINKETSYKDFENIFNGIDTEFITKVKWQKMPTDLLYFLYKMMDEKILTDEIERMNYKRLNACFCKADGSGFDENLKEIFFQIKANLVDKKDIDKLIKAIK